MVLGRPGPRDTCPSIQLRSTPDSSGRSRCLNKLSSLCPNINLRTRFERRDEWGRRDCMRRRDALAAGEAKGAQTRTRSVERTKRKEKKSAFVVRSLSFFFTLSPHLTLFTTPFTPLHPRTIALRICSRAVVPLGSTTCDLPTLHDPTRERYAKSDVALAPSRPLRLFEPTANPATFARLILYLSLRRPDQSFRRTDSGKGETGFLPFVQPIPILRDVRPLAYSPHKRS